MASAFDKFCALCAVELDEEKLKAEGKHVVERDGKRFCSEEHAKAYAEKKKEGGSDANVCEFC